MPQSRLHFSFDLLIIMWPPSISKGLRRFWYHQKALGDVPDRSGYRRTSTHFPEHLKATIAIGESWEKHRKIIGKGLGNCLFFGQLCFGSKLSPGDDSASIWYNNFPFDYGRATNSSFLWFRDFWTCPDPQDNVPDPSDYELWSTNFPEHLKATTVTKSPCTWVFSVFVVHLFASVVILGLIIGFNWLINTFFQGPGVLSHFWVPHWSCLRTNHGKVSKSMKMGYQKVA